MTVLAASFVEIAVRIVIAGVLIVATTVLSLRLLGTRRGWGTAFLAAVIGWTAACLLALTLSDWNWGADGLVVHILAIGVPLTMATAVTLDLLARPGSLAIGERAGLVVAPRPMRAVGRRVAVWRRYQELVRLARREGFGPLLSAQRRAERSVEPEGVRLRRVLEEAGGVYVKLGQIAATRIDLLPPEVCEELAKLQNRVGARADRGHPAGARGRARRRDERGLRRLRLGVSRRCLDRPDLPGSTTDGRGRRGEDPAARHRRRDGARPRGARPPRRRGAAPHAVRSGRSGR